MRQLFQLIKRFKRDERGVFLAMFAVMSLALIATSGAVVDFVGVQNARNEAQFALDAAALALQPRIYDSDEETLRGLAEDLVLERISNSRITVAVEEAEIILVDGTLFLEARIDVPLNFVSLVGMSEMTTRVVSQATRKKLFLEVAFVLDNSGSMGWYSRMTNLKAAATCATNIIFYGDCIPSVGATKAPNVEASIIPFTSMVNVGSGYDTASWMDTTGISSISNDNFDDDDDDSNTFSDPVSRFDLYDELNIDWEGCVEARHYPYSVNDAVPDVSTPDTLFAPMFAPDMPDSSGYGYDNSYLSDSGGVCPSENTCICAHFDNYTALGWYECAILNSSGGIISNGNSVCSCTSNPTIESNIYGFGSGTLYTCPGSGSLSQRERQERLCKYDGGSPSLSGRYGPNSDCPSRDILPLTDNTVSILADITAMVANGATNIHQGVIWGYHALSPTEPFAQGRGYDTAVSKVMIVMTDGENTYYGNSNMNGSDFNQAYGHLYNAPMTSATAYQSNSGRLGYNVSTSSQMPTVINTLTAETCENAKADGIEIYTIGLEPPNSTLENLLINCSSGTGYYFFPESSSELTDVFTEIANQLAALRLAQ